jgi:hypothetical protein
VKRLEAHYDKLAKVLGEFDLVVECAAPNPGIKERRGESADAVLKRIVAARGHFRPDEIADGSQALLDLAVEDIQGLDVEKVKRIASTIAMMDGNDKIQSGTISPSHLVEAIQYRRMLPGMWTMQKPSRRKVGG